MASDSSSLIDDMIEHFQEPLFTVSAITLLLTILKPIIGDGILYENMYVVLLLLFLASAYFTYLYFQGETKNKKYLGIPLLSFVTALFSWYSSSGAGIIEHDYTIFSIVAASFLFSYALYTHKIVRLHIALIIALFFSSLIVHMIPAFAPYIAEIDPYWHYKWAQETYYTGHIPEYDYMTYPLKGGVNYASGEAPGLDFTGATFMAPLLMAHMALSLKPLGISIQDSAMLWPAIFGTFAIVLVYLLIREMFREMQPYNEIAGFLGAFMLAFSPAYGVHAVATNCEDDMLGMFLLLSTFMLFFMSFKRRSIRYSLLAGFSFLLLNISWGGGYTYVFTVLGLFGVVYAFASFIQKRNCMGHVPYLIIPAVFTLFHIFFMHSRGELLAFNPPPKIAWLPLAGAVGISIILELIRSRRYGPLFVEGSSIADKVDNLLQKNIWVISLVVLMVSVYGLYSMGFMDTINFIYEAALSAKADSVVFQTIAEQNPLATDFQGFISNGYSRFGVALIYGLCMIPLLAYYGLARNSAGALFVLAWSLPMVWGVYHKSQYLFNSSAPIAALGATIGLFAAANKEDLEGVRVIATIMVLFVPMFYLPFLGDFNYTSFVGMMSMHMGPNADNYYWYPALEWMSNDTKTNEAFVTWWDYGHWITSIAHRPVLIDNLQSDHYEIQDIARFFVNKTTEEEAFEIIEAYDKAYKDWRNVNVAYVVIDWTMIGKGSALHYIANGDIKNNILPEPQWGWRNYGQCSFLRDQSVLQPQLVTDDEGNVKYVRRIVFGCSNYVRGVIFELEDDHISGINVVDFYGSVIPWDTWVKASPASLLGVQPLIGNATDPGILSLAIQRPNDNLLPTYRTLIYVPDEFNDFMMTRLYLGKYLDEYKALGLYTREVKPLKHFKEVQDFVAGYVRVYEIIYNVSEVENTSVDCLTEVTNAESSGAVLFYHTDSCPHCRDMMPLVSELESEGYSFKWLNAVNASNKELVDRCYSGILQVGSGVPQFGCVASGELHLGAFTGIDSVREFAESCRNSSVL